VDILCKSRQSEPCYTQIIERVDCSLKYNYAESRDSNGYTCHTYNPIFQEGYMDDPGQHWG
jgi:hypothetical protein